MSARYDIIVIGGGPAGSSAARHAAEQGARVLLLEKRPMPRPKLCGGWVSPAALDALKIPVPDEIVETCFRRLELYHQASPGGSVLEASLGVFVDRATFDALLVQRAADSGAAVRFEKAEAIAVEGASVCIRTADATYQAAGAILCTGASGELIKVLRPPDSPARSGICMEQRLPAEMSDRLALLPGTARLYFGFVPHGYGWLLHHGAYLLAGIGCRRSICSDVHGAYRAFWNSLALPPSSDAPRGHVIPLGGYRRVLGRGRVLAAGDAGGFVDAFSGDGIHGAIRSGQLAADALLITDGDAATVYSRSCRDLLSFFRQSLWAARVYYRLPGAFLSGFLTDAGTLARYSEVLAGRRGYRSFLVEALGAGTMSILTKNLRSRERISSDAQERG